MKELWNSLQSDGCCTLKWLVEELLIVGWITKLELLLLELLLLFVPSLCLVWLQLATWCIVGFISRTQLLSELKFCEFWFRIIALTAACTKEIFINKSILLQCIESSTYVILIRSILNGIWCRLFWRCRRKRKWMLSTLDMPCKQRCCFFLLRFLRTCKMATKTLMVSR